MTDIVHYYDILFLVLACTYFHALAAYIYLQNRKSLANRAFALMMFFLGQWAFSHILVVSNTRAEWALAFWKWSPVTAIFLAVSLFYFVLVYPKQKDIPGWAKLLIFGPATFFSLASLFTNLIVKDFQILNPTYVYLGKRVFGGLFLPYVLHQSFFVLGGALLAVAKSIWLKGVNRKQMALVSTALLVSGTTGLAFGMWLPSLLGLTGFYSLGPISAIFGAALIAYAILRYGLFLVTPQIAAQEILDSLGGIVLVCDPSGRVLYQGTKALNVEEDEKIKIISALMEKGDLLEYRIDVEAVPYSVSAAKFRQGGGIIMIFYDVTEIENEQEKERRVHKELTESYEKEKKTREVLANLVIVPEEREILEASAQILGKDSETMINLEHMAEVMREKKTVLAMMHKKSFEDKKNLEQLISEIEKVNRALIQKELKMVELKEKIKELKELKNPHKAV